MNLMKLTSKVIANVYLRYVKEWNHIYRFLKHLGFMGILKKIAIQGNFLLNTKKTVVKPRAVGFEVSNIYNLKCTMCPQCGGTPSNMRSGNTGSVGGVAVG
ncbi:MAG: hypothetical protein AB7T27_10705 [Kiritimatiellia bacterium]